MTYRTTQDIVIPAGTIVDVPPVKSSRWGEDYEAVVGHGKDHVSWRTINLQDALALGLVEKVEKLRGRVG